MSFNHGSLRLIAKKRNLAERTIGMQCNCIFFCIIIFLPYLMQLTVIYKIELIYNISLLHNQFSWEEKLFLDFGCNLLYKP